MDKDFIADAPADGGLVGSTSTAIPQQNNSRSTSQENTQASTPKNSAAPTAPGQDASSEANASIHASRNKENNSSPNASPNVDVNDDFLAAIAPNSAPQTLEKLKTNKAIIDAVNNLFLETYESYTGRARMTGSGDAKRLIINFQTAEARDMCVIARTLNFRTYNSIYTTPNNSDLMKISVPSKSPIYHSSSQNLNSNHTSRNSAIYSPSISIQEKVPKCNKPASSMIMPMLSPASPHNGQFTAFPPAYALPPVITQ
ncbi:hypothetical protein RirG_141430 [Rhizophagus irregularis DAOM 197198w]|uniref:Uncharacterized protein n=1 Tax=Rhizophagus irregularis (strain DAOM 197198w) TaxID=1432141 RepID=A0A015KX25_RHIIW|nr:hypothetical protein RirG_141430 [Rhizophagus irregularis DAOM 197198w]